MSDSVVIVDDDPAFVYALRLVLLASGYRVAAFSSSVAAWDELKSTRRPKLLVTDLSFPSGEPNGVALARHARAHHAHLPVMYITGHVEFAGIAAAEKIGLVFQKSVDIHQVAARIAEIAPLTPADC